MKLYEATNGFTGYSAVRCFVWANNRTEARGLAEKAFKEDATKSNGESIYPERYWKNINLRLIVDAETDKEPFHTRVED